ncbi:MAG: DUF4386 domain-containing protein [Actinobacteria bacterium]|nr:DUF4386 domain-containing protein [Actinomycetota bacterium]
MHSINKTARVAALLYLLLVPLGFFGIDMIALPTGSEDVATTANEIMASESMFRLSIVSALLVQLVNIFLVLVLYRLLKPVNRNMALMMVLFIMLVVPIAMLNELNRIAALLLASGVDYMGAFSTEQLQALVPFFIELNQYGIAIAGIFWGLWLFPMGYLIFRSGYLPRIIGILLMIACFGYLIDSFAKILIAGYEGDVVMFTFWGEILLPLWLLIKGVNVEQWEKRALESA